MMTKTVQIVENKSIPTGEYCIVKLNMVSKIMHHQISVYINDSAPIVIIYKNKIK